MQAWRFALVVLVFACVRLTGAGVPPMVEGGPIELWNGRDFLGWSHILADSTVSRDAVWSIQDGAIVCMGSPVGVLYTEKVFTNFRLVVEYRWAPGTAPGNSGIMSRLTVSDLAIPRCVEVQLKHGSAGDLFGVHGLHVGGDAARAMARTSSTAGQVTGVKRITDAERPAGAWNRVEILAERGDYRVWINGTVVNEASDVEVSAGPIGLQSEGGEIHFRRVTVTPLPD